MSSPFDISHARKLDDAVPQPGVQRLAPSPCGACTVRHLTLCAPLEQRELSEVAKIVTPVELDPGERLFDEGEDAPHVYSVTAGTMKLYKLLPDGRRQVTGFLHPGDFLGLAARNLYAYSAEAVTHAVLCRFPRRRLEALLQRFPKMERRLLGMAGHELVAAQEQMLLLGRKTAKERLASFLLTLSRRAAQRGQLDNPVSLPMSRNDIGDYLGLTTETVSRSFTLLKTGGLISLKPGGKVELIDRQSLEKLAEGD